MRLPFLGQGPKEFPASIPPPAPYTALSIVPVLLIHALKTTSVFFFGNLSPLRRNAQGLASHKDEKVSERQILSGEHLRG